MTNPWKYPGVSVTMTANMSKLKWKNTVIPIKILYFLSPLPFCLDDVLKNWSPLLSYFLAFYFPLRKMREVKSNVYSPTSMKQYLILFLCLHWNILMVFSMFLLLFAIFNMFSCKYFPRYKCFIYDQIKQKVGNRLYPPTKNSKTMKTLQTKQI